MNVMDKVHFFLPIEEVEGEAYAQIARTASMPFVSHLAVMPDVHAGKGSTVGTVVKTEGALMPACVGVDIGCGMVAMKTAIFTTIPYSPSDLRALRERIEAAVPVGIGGKGINESYSKTAELHIADLEKLANNLGRERDYYTQFGADWRLALGSLGGGNHFIEVCAGNDGYMWLTLHSGSRGVGNKLATFHARAARDYCKRKGVTLPDPDLAYLEVGTPEYVSYVKDLTWAQEFAYRSRQEMMTRVAQAFEDTFSWPALQTKRLAQIINCHHNYTEMDNNHHTHITRKGAIRAKVGDVAMIPGSMGACSYIVEGLGNEEALWSAPHGAGRRMSRTKAKATFSLGDLTEAMEGVEARVRESIIDEHPNAYKSIDTVLFNSRTLVRPLITLTPLVSIKGD